MKDLLLIIKENLLKKEPVVLVTITESSGSTPRHAGARMLVGKGPDSAPLRLWGSIGGGIMEYSAIEDAANLLQSRRPHPADIQKKYLLHSAEAGESGAVCGGEMTASFRYIDSEDSELFKEIENEKTSCGIVCIFGGGHVAQELVPILARLDFRCVVFDDRKEFVKAELFPGVEKIILGDFEHIGKSITLTENDYAVVLTRGHIWDLEAWAFALESRAAYIGVIGSKSKHEFVKEKLRQRGFSHEAINAPRVHAPIGIKIKSETPAEIAVSIAAELIQCRALYLEGGL